MSSSSSNNMEEDAWLMKIELKTDEPVGAANEDKNKEATGDKVSAIEQALPTDEEEEDILNLIMLILPPLRLQPLESLKRFVCKTSTSLVKIFCIKSTSPPSGASSVDWRISWSLRTGSLLLHHHHLLLRHQNKIEHRVWALPLAFAKLGGGAPVSYHLHYLLPLLFLLVRSIVIFCFR